MCINASCAVVELGSASTGLHAEHASLLESDI